MFNNSAAMFRLLRILSCFAFLSYWIPAYAQVPMTGAGLPTPSVILPGPATCAAVSSSGVNGTNSLATVTFSLSTGVASTNRLVMVSITGFTNSTTTITAAAFTSPTAVGTNTQIYTNINGSWNIVTGQLATGTTATLTLTTSSAASGTYRAFVYYCTDYTQMASTTPTIGFGSGTGTSQTIAPVIPNSGSLLLIGSSGQGYGSQTISASTPTITTDETFNVILHGHALNVSAQTASITETWTGTNPTFIGLGWAIFR